MEVPRSRPRHLATLSRASRLTQALGLQVPKARGAGRSGPRRRTGCLTCRARKVRCDETKPSCANCDRLRLRCTYKPPIALGESWMSATCPSGTSIATVRTAAQNTPAPAIDSASAVAAVTATPNSSHREPDPTFFNTVLRSDEHHRAIPAPATTNRRLPSDAELHPLDLGGPFDMLGFMGGITSELEQKHIDLTSGLAAFTTSPAPQNQLSAGRTTIETDEGESCSERRSPLSPGAPSSLVDGVSIGSASDAATTRGSWSDPGSTSYEEQLLHHFLAIDAPAGIFAPVTMEWQYVRPAVLARAREFSPLLNAIYCYSDIHKALMEGKQWRWAPTYHRVASAEIQACLLGEITNSTLIKIFAAVFFLMLSEVNPFQDPVA